MGKKGTIGILTGGGDVPGLNPAIRAATIRATRNGYDVMGIRRGWAGLVEFIAEKGVDNSDHVIPMDERVVNDIGRVGGTFLHTSRTRPSHVKKNDVPEHLKSRYNDEVNDLTPEVIKNLEFLGIEYLVPIGGDDTLSYGQHLHKEGFKVVAIPKTMDNDVPGTDYCIGFSTCMTRTIELTNRLRTSGASHERFIVIEVFGRYAGFSALLPTMAGAANRCVIPEHEVDFDHLTRLMVKDREENPSNYSIVLVSEGATFSGGDMVFEGSETDAYGHKKLGGVGDRVSAEIKNRCNKFTKSTKGINFINQKLAYLVRCGDPDSMDSVVPMVYGNLALDLIMKGKSGLLVNMKKGTFGNVPLDIVTSYKKLVDVEKWYDTKRLRPKYHNFEGNGVFALASE